MSAQRARKKIGKGGILVLALVLGLGTLIALRLAHKKKPAAAVPTVAVDRQDIVVTVEADGAIEPINVVDVKSKASGQIVKMPVEIGTVVRQGALLAQIDPRDVRNQYNQTLAALKAAQVQNDVSTSQKKRSDQLSAEKVITAQEHEAAILDIEQARASLVKARTDLDLARQRLEDATVRAPIAGTVIAKPVAVGQVISSATSSVSGGTSLLSMADLRKIRLRALVNETDIGNVHPGEEATVVVDAYPDRPFSGMVEKVEPQAIVEQSVTMFPVLVSISNEEGLLMPGMNGQVTILVERRDGVLAVPVDAVRSVRELPQTAAALGLDVSTVRASMRARGGGAGGAEPSPASAAAGAPGGGGGQGRRGRSSDSMGVWGRVGGRDSMRAGGGAGRGMGWRRRAAGDTSTARGFSRDSTGTRSSRRGQARIVFVQTATGFTPRFIRIGVSNYDYAQVLSGLEEGERVALISAAQLQRQREEGLQRIRQRMGTGVPGMQGGGGSRQGGGSRSGGGG